MARVAQDVVEVLMALPTGTVRVAQHVVEVLFPRPAAPSPTSVTGSAVSQYVVEALLVPTGNNVRVAQYVVEVLINPTSAGVSPGTGTRRAWVSFDT